MSKTGTPYYTQGRILIIERDILHMDKVSRVSLPGDDTIMIHMDDGKVVPVKPFNAISLLVNSKEALVEYMSKLAKTIWPGIGQEKKEEKKPEKEKKEKNPLEGRVKALEVENKKLQETLDILEARLDSLQASKGPQQPTENLLDI